MSHRSHRALATLGVALAVTIATAAPAAADPAGPTDFQTEIVAVEPAVPTIDLRMIGGDSFIEMEVQPGVDVVVIGYRGEPYLWFAADGRVYENDRSPSTYLASPNAPGDGR